MKCLLCNKRRRYISKTRPLCRKCEKTAPSCIAHPLLFTDVHRTPATLVACAVLAREVAA